MDSIKTRLLALPKNVFTQLVCFPFVVFYMKSGQYDLAF